ncbi:Dam family site-specific DNA-(adenine-N6)-methyltransferase [Macrococcus equi]|uniref:Dam family site-specific DNA-(adenine-N6)-methyltransferase n=1 Tax=Macrococcus equi TaxID=3395462 RepID=UPI0039BE5C4A
MRVPQAIPYQGSKRKLANQIIDFMPNRVERFIEPFAGSAAMSMAISYNKISENIWINEINKPLAELLELIINSPGYVSDVYEKLWNEQLDNPQDYYLKKRKEFNYSQDPIILLYLLVRCVKNAVRYNEKGEFNQSPDKRRLGRNPVRMRKDLFKCSLILKDKTKVTSESYYDIIQDFTSNDLVYLDPPYMGTVGGSRRYIQVLDLNLFTESLYQLNERKIPFILSFDGMLGDKTYGNDLPVNLNLKKVLIEAGVSTQSTLNGKTNKTIESLYISKAAENLLYDSNIKVVNNQFSFIL